MIRYDDDSFSIYVVGGSVDVNFNYIVNIYVDENMRRKGIGSYLLRECEKVLSKSEYNNVICDAIPFDSAPFYLKNGYKLEHPDGYRFIKDIKRKKRNR